MNLNSYINSEKNCDLRMIESGGDPFRENNASRVKERLSVSTNLKLIKI